MANLDSPNGFNPIGKIGGGTSPAMNKYTSLGNYATAIFQGDSETASTQAMVGLYMDSVKTHAGNSTTGISGDELDVSTNSTTLTGAKVLGLAQTPDNSFAAHGVLRCFLADAVHLN